MRKNYFAKKFVAYSMAFAVAFSTLTVSPVFVKEAKAATTVAITNTATANNAIADKTTILESVESTKAGSTVDLTVVKEKLNITDMINPGLAIADDKDDTAKVGTMAIGTFSDDSDGTNDFYLKDAGTTVVSSTGNNKPVIFDGKDSTTSNGNKNIKLTPATGAVNGTASYTWYKLTPATNSFELTTGTGSSTTTETITVKYYVVEQLHQSENHEIALATEDSLGYYLSVKKGATSGTDYKLWNLYESSKLTVSPERTEFKVNNGDNARLIVNATSNKSTLTYKWKFGTKVLADTTNVCTVDKVDATKLGYYSCEVSDGVKTKTVSNIKLLLNKYGTVAKRTYSNVAKVLEGETYYLVNDTATFTSVVPKQDDYEYVWTVSTVTDKKTVMSESDIQKYDASNNTFTLNKEDTSFENAIVTCNVYYKNDYLSAKHDTGADDSEGNDIFEYMKDKVEAYNKATTDITKYEAKKAIIDFEQHITANPVYTETFTLLPVTDETITSENIVKNVNDSLSVSTPEVEGRDAVEPVGSKAGNSAGTVSYALDVPSTSGNDALTTNVYALDRLYATDFGTYVFTTTETYDEYKTIAQDATSADPGYTVIDYNNPTSTITLGVNSVAQYEAANEGTKLVQKKAATPVVTTKMVNVVYNPDLTVSAKDISAKIGEEITLNVDATSKLPLEIKWYKQNNFQTVYGDATDITKTKKFVVKSTDIYKPAEYTSEGDLKAGTDVNYVNCVVKNGIETKTVRICVNKLGGFTIKNVFGYDSNNNGSFNDGGDVLPGTSQTTNFNETVYSLADRTVELTTDVTANEGSNVTYAWYKNTVAGTPLATTSNYSVAFKGTSNEIYKCVIGDADTTEEIIVTYTIKPVSTTSVNDALVAYAPQKFVYAYTGEAIKPVVVTYSNAVLTEGTDYDITYIDNIDAGVAFYEITFKGDFKELKPITKEDVAKANKDFTIVKIDNKVELADASVVLGSAVLPKVTTNLGKAALAYTFFADEACTTEIAVPTKVGTYYVKATAAATANYKETESNVVKVVVVPGKVKMLGTSRTASSVKLNWTKATGATSYRVYYKAQGAKSYKVFKNTTATSMNVTELASATTYTFAVKAYAKTAGYSTVYATKQTTTAPAKVATPSVTAGSKKATVKFTKVARATGYQIYMAKGNGKYVKVKTTTSTSFTKTGLAKGATYKFKVRAYKTVGSNTYYGAFSSAKAVKVK